jgi:DNA gyrase subunit B
MLIISIQSETFFSLRERLISQILTFTNSRLSIEQTFILKKMNFDLLLVALGFLISIQSFHIPYPSLSKVGRIHKISRENYKFSKVSLLNQPKAYDAEAITVLTGLEPVRKRPGMYIGSTGSKGLHHLVFEVLDNSIDEALAGFCDDIKVTLHENGDVEVTDNGRGIPCSVHPMTGKSTLETVLCVLHAGGKFGGETSGYKVSGGLHGVGISVVNALSDRLTAEVVRDGKFHQMTFSRGEPTSSLVERNSLPSESQGTRIIFHPDKDIFKTTTDFEYDILANRIDELAYLNPGLSIKMIDARKKSVHGTVNEKLFRHDGGISELIDVLCHGKTALHTEVPVIAIKEDKKNITVDIAMRWSSDQYDDNVFGFANGIRTSDGKKTFLYY